MSLATTDPAADATGTEPSSSAVGSVGMPGTFRAEVTSLTVLALPLIGAQLAQISMNAVDTVMAGWLGPRDLAAVAIGGNIWIPIYVIGIGILLAVTPSVAQLYGAGQREEIGPLVRQGLWLGAIVTAMVFVVVLLLIDPLLDLVQASADLHSLARGYVLSIALGTPGQALFNVLRNYCEGLGRTGPSLWVSLTALPVNVALNYVLMYGAFGLPRLGAIGCGIASALTMWFMAACLLLVVLSVDEFRRDELFSRWDRPRFDAIARLFLVGGPIAVSFFVECALFCSVGLILARMGEQIVGGHQIALNVASITFMVPLGVALAVTIRVGQAIGAGDPRAARRTGLAGNLLSLSFMGCMAALMGIFPGPIARLYTGDAQVIETASQLLFLAAVFQVFDGLQVSGAGALRGLKDTRVPMAITMIAYWVFALPVGYTLAFHAGWGPRGLWSGLIAGLCCASFLMNLRFYTKVAKLIRASEPETES